MNINFPVDAIEDTIFGDYERLYSGKNETCSAYRFGEALVALGAMFGRSISLVGHGAPIYPNWYVTLVGPSYFSKKSQSSQFNTARLLKKDNDILVLDSVGSSESLIRHLAEHSEEIGDIPPRCVILCDELRNLYLKSRQSATESIIPKLTELYGCPEDQKIKTGVEAYVEEPTLSIMGNMTPRWFNDTVSYSDVGGGFVNRFLFLMHEQQPWKYKTEYPSRREYEQWWESVDKVVNTYAGRKVRFRLDAEALEFGEQCYKQFNDELLKSDALVVDASARNFDHVHKLALLLAVFKNGDGDHEVSLESLSTAFAIGEYFLNVKRELFSTLTADKMTADEHRLLKALQELGGEATLNELGTKIGRQTMSAETRNRILQSLNMQETIALDTQGRATLVKLINTEEER